MEIKYSLELILPAITIALGTIGKDIDAVVKIDQNENPYFNGKQIKGILKERVISFRNALGLSNPEKKEDEFIDKYFGKKGNDISEMRFDKIRFSNLTLVGEKKDLIGDRYGIRVSRKLKSTIHNSLFNYEYIKSGAVFQGTLEVNDNIEREDLKFILASLFHLDYIGGLKSRGLGKVKVLIEEKNIKELDKILDNLKRKKETNYSLNNEMEKYSYSLELKEPVIIKKKTLGNYLYSKDIIQGSTLRGAIIEYFLKQKVAIDKLLKIEVSDALIEDIKLASSFQTKYEVDGKKVTKDKVIYRENEYKNTKLERNSLSILDVTGNEIGIGIDSKIKSAKENMLFNYEFIDYKKKLKGDIILPKGLLEKLENKKIDIYIGSLKSKGFGKTTISFAPYTEQEKLKLEERIKKLNSQIKEDKTIIAFDLNSDLILPFNEIYNIAEQFKMLLPFETEMKFDSKRSFINTDILRGYNIVNNSRKVDELIICRGSVITYEIPQYKNYLEELKSIETEGLGLRKYDGFGRIKICSCRGDN